MARSAKTPEQFAAELADANPSVELLVPYTNARIKLACRCLTCRHEWEALPGHLLQGHGCPSCAGTGRIDPEDFARRVSQTSPGVELLSSYVNARARIACRCKVCGAEWAPYPRSLLQGHGCPECAKRIAAGLLAQRNKAAKEC